MTEKVVKSNSRSREAVNKERDSEKLICEKEDCNKEAERWTISYYDDEEEDFGEEEHILCGEHAAEAGFCLRCGQFCGGIESYHFTGIDGYCSECSDVIKHEIGFPEEQKDPNQLGLMEPTEIELMKKEGSQ